MAIAALILMDGHRTIGRMTESDTSRTIENMILREYPDARMVGDIVIERRLLVHMAIQAIYRAMTRIHNHHVYRGPGGNRGVDIPVRIMAGRAEREVGGHDIRPIKNRMAVGARDGDSLAEIGRTDLNRMVDRPPSDAMIVSREITGMATRALSGLAQSGTPTQAGRRIVAGVAAVAGMNLTRPNEGTGGGHMAADTVHAIR